jgi:hypothetical protein
MCIRDRGCGDHIQYDKVFRILQCFNKGGQSFSCGVLFVACGGMGRSVEKFFSGILGGAGEPKVERLLGNLKSSYMAAKGAVLVSAGVIEAASLTLLP